MKSLPNGVWITLNSMPPITTPEDIQAYLSSGGIELPLENIIVNQCRVGQNDFAQGIISLNRAAIVTLFGRAVQDLTVHAVAPRIVYKQE